MVHPYVASKWAVRGPVQISGPRNWRPHNIRVNSIHPGFIRTPMTKHFPDDMVTVPLGRPGVSDEVATFVLFFGQRRILLCHRRRIRDGRRPWSTTSRHKFLAASGTFSMTVSANRSMERGGSDRPACVNRLGRTAVRRPGRSCVPAHGAHITAVIPRSSARPVQIKPTASRATPA